MKYLIVIALLFFGLFSCNNSSEKNKTENKSTPVVHEENPNSIEGDVHPHNHEGHDHEGHNHVKPEGELMLGAYIGIWEYHHSSSLVKNGYVKHWIDIKRDMTFERGIGSKATNKGKWLVVEEKGDPYLDLDYEDNSNQVDEKWRTQINSPVLILIGNSDKMKSGEMIKLDKRDERPADK